ncbi:hypothetical protein E2562_020205 [Oryza meyeriana var. granulata]|uniref:Uncharacterized protein n=1 Tax=Oryza meyeriana var. granulata TaxID=110450 RepID=A0A6G1BM07_9ORYZ|nr:hypothetical protein E2562_020205 [Oryza meyeriana var. granulata]
MVKPASDSAVFSLATGGARSGRQLQSLPTVLANPGAAGKARGGPVSTGSFVVLTAAATLSPSHRAPCHSPSSPATAAPFLRRSA